MYCLLVFPKGISALIAKIAQRTCFFVWRTSLLRVVNIQNVHVGFMIYWAIEFIPGQPLILQLPVSVSGPSWEQLLPPGLGGGLVQERLRECRPPPQEAEQRLHELQAE